MICYVGLSVQIHGLNDPNPEIIRSKVQAAPGARASILTTTATSIVEIDEHAGTPNT